MIDGDDSEPHLGFKISIVLSIMFLLMIGTVAAAHTPIQTIDGIGGKVVVKKVVKTENVISGWFKPSVQSGYSYKWHYRTWINHCSYCGGHLLLNPKGVPERELTCSKCSADYDGVTGYVKNGRFNKRLTRA